MARWPPCWRRWATPCGATTRRRRRRSSSRCAPWGSTWPPVTAPRAPDGRGRGHLHGHPGRRPRRGGGRGRRGAGAAPVGGAGRHLRPAHHAGGGRYPRQDDDVRPAGHDPRGHGPQAGLGGRGRHRRAGPQRGLGRRRAARGRGRRERRHVPVAGRPHGHRHQPGGRPPRAAGAGSRPCAPASNASWPPSTGRRCCASTTPAPRA